jgi:uncharacterized protein YcaQ
VRVLHLDASTARRYLVLRHLLAPPRSLAPDPASVMRVVERLGSLQFDPIDVTGRNHDLVLAARIAGYRRAWTDDLLYRDRLLFEAYNKGLSLLPTAELPWYRIAWDRARARHEGGAFDEHAPLVDELLGRIRDGGPLSSTDVEPRPAIDWYWRPTNQVRALLEALGEAGILGLARREGNRRIYDLAERLFPEALLAERRDPHEQRRHKLLSRHRANGLLGRSGSAELWLGAAPGTRTAGADPSIPTRAELTAELLERGELLEARVEGVRGVRYLPATDLLFVRQAEAEVAAGLPPGVGQGGAAADPADAGVAFLAPLDPLAWDRDLLRMLFGFDYRWEVYVPAARRRWGYYVLPLLWGDRLVGRIAPRFERAPARAGSKAATGRTLRIAGLWWEAGFDPLAAPGFMPALAGALEAHRAFGDAHRIALPRTARHRALTRALRPLLAR